MEDNDQRTNLVSVSFKSFRAFKKSTRFYVKRYLTVCNNEKMVEFGSIEEAILVDNKAAEEHDQYKIAACLYCIIQLKDKKDKKEFITEEQITTYLDELQLNSSVYHDIAPPLLRKNTKVDDNNIQNIKKEITSVVWKYYHPNSYLRRIALGMIAFLTFVAVAVCIADLIFGTKILGSVGLGMLVAAIKSSATATIATEIGLGGLGTFALGGIAVVVHPRPIMNFFYRIGKTVKKAFYSCFSQKKDSEERAGTGKENAIQPSEVKSSGYFVTRTLRRAFYGEKSSCACGCWTFLFNHRQSGTPDVTRSQDVTPQSSGNHQDDGTTWKPILSPSPP